MIPAEYAAYPLIAIFGVLLLYFIVNGVIYLWREGGKMTDDEDAMGRRPWADDDEWGHR